MQAAVRKLKASLTKLKDARDAGDAPGPDLLRHLAEFHTAAADCCERGRPKTAAVAGAADAAFEDCAGIVDGLTAPANVAGQPVAADAPGAAGSWAVALAAVRFVWSVVEQYRRKA
jgi:hypothetical protein